MGLFSKKSEKDTENTMSVEEIPKEDIHRVGLFKIYSVATVKDYFMLLLGTIAAAAAGACSPLMTVIFGKMIDTFTIYGSGGSTKDQFQADINYYALFFIYLAIVVFICTYTYMSTFQWVGAKSAHKIRNLYLQSLLKQEIAWFDNIGSGEVTTRITNDTGLVQGGISEKVALIIHDCCTFISAFIIAFTVNWRLSLMLFCIVPAIGILISAMVFFGLKYISSSLEKYSIAGNTAEECFSTIRTIAAFNLHSKMGNKYDGLLVKAQKDAVLQSLIFSIGISGMFFLTYCAYSLTFYYGALLIGWNLGSIGSIVNTLFAIMIGALALGSISPSIEAVAKAQGAAAKLFQCIDRVPEIDSSSNEGLKLDQVRGDIEFRNIKFTYPSRKDVQIFENFSLSIKAGQTVAFVGPSGSGKSTTIQLLERFYDPDSGEIVFDGNPIKDLNIKWYRRQIGLVSQEPTLFNGTIADNVTAGLVGTPLFNGSKEKQMEAIIKACKHSNAHDFISNLPLKYETQVGERGFLLSGGQKQRIAIARAIIRNPRILLLDEATSALDTKSEVIVQKALDRVSKDRTTIVIAHRLSTIRNADLIVVVEKGKIIEQGTHESLLQNAEGTYTKLVQLQGVAKDPQEDEDSEDEIINAIFTKRAIAHHSEKAVEAFPTNTQGSNVGEEVGEAIKAWGFFTLAFKVLSQNSKEWKSYIFGALGAAVLGCISPVLSILLAKVIVALNLPPPKLYSEANFWSLMFLILAFAACISTFCQMYFFGANAQVLTARLRSSVFKHLLQQEIGWYDRKANSTGALTSSLSTDAQDIQGLSGTTFGTILQAFVNVVGSVIIGLIYGWKMTLVCCTTLPILLYTGYYQVKIVQGFEEENKNAYSDSAELACEASSAVRTVTSLTKEESVCNKYNSIMQAPLRSNFKKAFYSSAIFSASRSVEFLCSALAFWYGSQLVKNNEYSFGQMFTIFSAIITGAGGASKVFAYIPDIYKARKAAGSIFNLIERVSLIDSTEDSPGKRLPIDNSSKPIKGHIKVESAHFSYPTRPGARVLKGVSFEAHPGQFIALVGPSGCGKSTIISLLERFYDLNKGSIKVDGVDVRDYHLPSLRTHMALVSQEPSLYDMTIAENIAMGTRNDTEPVNQQEIEAAAKKVNLHNFVMTLPKGYETNVGSRGTQLSGGQKQRVAIARALIRNPSILLLDEATSALDAESERIVQDALDSASVGRTTIAIAHRLSTIQKADLILVFQQHRIVESGTHQQLLNKKGFYFEMVNQQNLEVAH
jgi:ATP-binding cassette subfamily B (MDR/TAP) protein 1